uniref:Putative secreted protein n=1 Tax=Xenopsylla cheopis TaxID=163159 RepID=A0A6M2DXM5_XENCH
MYMPIQCSIICLTLINVLCQIFLNIIISLRINFRCTCMAFSSAKIHHHLINYKRNHRLLGMCNRRFNII